jgi:hypothetical protein
MKDNTQIERTAINRVSSFFTEQFNWIVREQPILDYGIDMQLEIKDENNITGVLIALQIKGGNSHCRIDKNKNFVYRGKLRHLAYWNNHSLPIIFIWYNESNENLYWQIISPKSPNIKILKKGWTLKIPKNNILGSDSKNKIINECFNCNSYEIIEEKDISISKAKRYTLKIIIYEEKRFIIKRIIENIHNTYLTSRTNINTLTIFYYKNVSQIDYGFTFCITQWNNPKYQYKLNTIICNDKINNINIEWKYESDFFNDSLIDNNQYISNSKYIEICNKSMSISEKLIKKINLYDLEKTEQIILSFNTKINSEINSVLNQDFKITVDMKPLKKIRDSTINWLQNIQIIFQDKNRTIDNKQDFLKFYIKKIEKDIKEYRYYKEILKR